MTPEELLAQVEARGVRVLERLGSLAVSPVGVLLDAEREALRSHKAEVIRVLRVRALGLTWSRLSLYSLDRVLEVEVPWSDQRLIIAPGCRVARELRAVDRKPGRIWCACEVLDLLLTNVTPDDARRIAEAKVELGGTTESVLADPPPPDDNPAGDWLWMCAKCRRACRLYVAGTDL